MGPMGNIQEVTTLLANDTFNVTSRSPTGSPHENHTCPIADATFDFMINSVIIGMLCILGMVGNSLSIVVLQKDRNNNVAIFLLQALAVADNLLLAVSFVTLSLWKGLLPFVYNDRHALRNSMVYIPVIINPIGYMTQTATVWVTVLLALNRFLAVCKPFQAHILCTLKRAKLQVLGVTLFAICFNFPRFFQHKIIEIQVVNADNDDVVFNVTHLSLSYTELGFNKIFGIVYTNALYSILVLVLPMLLLLILNCQIVYELRRCRSRRSATGGPSHQDDSISFIMIIIIVVFIVCQTPDRILQIFAVLIFSKINCSVTKERLVGLCNLLVIINSSTNFIIYYVFRKSFREILKMHMCTFGTGADVANTSRRTVILESRIPLTPIPLQERESTVNDLDETEPRSECVQIDRLI